MNVMDKLDLHRIADRNRLTIEEVARKIEIAKRSMLPNGKRVTVVENGVTTGLVVTQRGIGTLKTHFGRFHQFLFHIDDIWGHYSALVKAQLDKNLKVVFNKSNSLLLRIDSGCQTGQVFGDRTCECSEQLFKAMEKIKEVGEGIIINIPGQDGRGKSLLFKLATLMLQDQLHLNTVEAASTLAPNEEIDTRTYGGVIGILKFFNVTTSYKIELITNNPKKAKIFHENGYVVADLNSIIIPATELTKHHLRSKQKFLGHINLVREDEGGDKSIKKRSFNKLKFW